MIHKTQTIRRIQILSLPAMQEMDVILNSSGVFLQEIVLNINTCCFKQKNITDGIFMNAYRWFYDECHIIDDYPSTQTVLGNKSSKFKKNSGKYLLVIV